MAAQGAGTGRGSASSSRPTGLLRSSSSRLSMETSGAGIEDGPPERRKSPKRSAIRPKADQEEEEEFGQVYQRAVKGEQRLKINFESLGTLGEHIQRCSRTGHQLIPHGLRGTHGMYEQTWRFEISHGQLIDAEEGLVLITWTIQNLVSGTTTSVTETTEEAYFRLNKGRTICNRVVRQAMQKRYDELEEMLGHEDPGSIRAANIKSLMRSVRTERKTVGLLFFGLLHERVWHNLQRELQERSQESAVDEETKVPDVAGTAAFQLPSFPPPLPLGYEGDEEVHWLEDLDLSDFTTDDLKHAGAADDL